jgi:hypothetical protein
MELPHGTVTFALARGAAMDDHELVGYAQAEYRRIAALRPEPG